ncbi:MAG: hypothetical protein LBC50_00760 [Candidatus Ancillula sp.]|jgi:tetratricopeptide (TPR) repeat protein|nr:hypothetical protein [Candidatus Ancillula sp.]
MQANQASQGKDNKFDELEEIDENYLSPRTRAELASLGKDKAKQVGHYVAAALLFLESQPERAVIEAKKAVGIASRLASVRELLGISAYKAGDYQLAIRELTTARRVNGQSDYLPLIADAYRGVGQPEKVFKIAGLDEIRKLDMTSHVEMTIVLAGAYADLGNFNDAQRTITHGLKLKGISTEARLRLLEARGTFYERAGDDEEASKVWKITEPIRQKIDYSSETPLIVYDVLEKEA